MRFKGLTLAFLAATVACGVKSSPQPPLSYTPEKVQSITLKQQGDILYIIWQYSGRYIDGRKIGKFKQQILLNEKIKPLKIHKSNGYYWAKLKLDNQKGKELCFQIKVITKKESSVSNLKCIKPIKTPLQSLSFSLKQTQNGVKLNFNSKGKEILVYKGSSKEEIPPIIYAKTQTDHFLDKDVKNKNKYCYYITQKLGNVESTPSDTKCITFLDTYPPPPPKNVSYVIKQKKLYIFWDLPKDKDIIGVIIEKKGEKILNVPIKSYYFIDTSFKKGDIYTIYTVDKAGNKSKPVYLKIE